MQKTIITIIVFFLCLKIIASTIVIDNEFKSKIISVTADKLTQKSDLKFTLINTHNSHKQLLLEIPIETIKYANLYIQNNTQSITSTYSTQTITKRTYYDRDIIFKIDLPPNAQVPIVLKLTTTKKKSLNLIFWDKAEKINKTQALELSRGIFYGLLVLFTFLCLLLYILIRERNYLLFFFYLFVGTLYMLIKSGIGSELLWPNYPQLDFYVQKIILLVYILTALNFVRSFLLKRIERMFFNTLVKKIILIGVLFIIGSLISNNLPEKEKAIFFSIQKLYMYVCVLLIILSFIYAFFRIANKAIFYFTLMFIVSFTFFLFYPIPTNNYGTNYNLKQFYVYLNSFVVAIVITATVINRILYVLEQNKTIRSEVSRLHAEQNYDIIRAEMNERKRVGKELHDGIGILMATTKMKLSSLKNEEPQQQELIKKITTHLDSITQIIRNFSHELLPPTLIKFGLKTAVLDMLEEYNTNHKHQIKFNYAIADNLNEVNNYIVYSIIENLFSYFRRHNNYDIQIIVQDKHLDTIHLLVYYSGIIINKKQKNIIRLNSFIDLIHGTIEESLMSSFTHKLEIDFPLFNEM